MTNLYAVIARLDEVKAWQSILGIRGLLRFWLTPNLAKTREYMDSLTIFVIARRCKRRSNLFFYFVDCHENFALQNFLAMTDFLDSWLKATTIEIMAVWLLYL